MEHSYYLDEQTVLNDRWLFVIEHDRLIDLEGRVDSVTLKPVASRILALLIATPHVILRRRQLLDEGWRAFGFEVCENSLNQVMCALRSAFAALDPGRIYIKTVPRVGYYLLADVREPTTAERLMLGGGGPEPSAINDTSTVETSPVLRRLGEMCEKQCLLALPNDRPLSLLIIRIEAASSSPEATGGGLDMAALMLRIRLTLYRPQDCVTRHGDNFFSVLLPDTNLEGATHVAERIRRMLQTEVIPDDANLLYSFVVSVGVAEVSPSQWRILQSGLLAVDSCDVPKSITSSESGACSVKSSSC